jgi:hypothetical protein
MTHAFTRALPALAIVLAVALPAGGALAQANGGGGAGGGSSGSAGGSGTDAWINPAFLVAQSPNGVPGTTVPPYQVQKTEIAEICGIKDQSGARYVYCHQLRRR